MDDERKQVTRLFRKRNVHDDEHAWIKFVSATLVFSCSETSISVSYNVFGEFHVNLDSTWNICSPRHGESRNVFDASQFCRPPKGFLP